MIAMLAVGCDAPDEGRGPGVGSASGGKADDAEGDGDGEVSELQRAHLEAVSACEVRAQRDRDHTSELRIDRMELLEDTRTECLREANDQITDDLEATLTEAGSSLEGDTDNAFDGWRNASSGLCDLLTDASEEGRLKGASVTHARCVGDAELQLAELVQSFADLGGPRAEAETERDRYELCYDAFDTAAEAADADLDAAAVELTACIRDDLLDESGLELALRISETYPGRDQDMILEDLENKFSLHSKDASDLCMVLGAASPAAGSPDAEGEFHRCEVSAAVWMGELILAVVPEVDPDAEPEPTPDGG
jgi:hypothetical protein